MDQLLNATIFNLVDPPNIRVTRPKWMQLPSAMQVFSFVLVTYFLVTAGIIYDIINEPPSVGSTTDERGHQKPVAIMPYRINGQYIMEGLAASFMFTLGGFGFIVLERCNDPMTPRLNRLIMLGVGVASVIIAFLATRMFMKIKMPSYG